jgi:hypothetical protein
MNLLAQRRVQWQALVLAVLDHLIQGLDLAVRSFIRFLCVMVHITTWLKWTRHVAPITGNKKYKKNILNIFKVRDHPEGQ